MFLLKFLRYQDGSGFTLSYLSFQEENFLEEVKELREMSGVGMMKCKKALVETDGDLEKALDLL